MKAFLLISLFVSPIECFVSPKPTDRKSLTKSYLSLEDEWSELSNIASFSNQKPIEAAMKTAKNIQWEKMFSPEWTAGVQTIVKSSFQAYSMQPFYLQSIELLAPVALVASLWLYTLSFPDTNYRQGMEPYDRGNYDPIQARAYYKEHPFLLLQRSLEIFRLSNRFLFSILVDKYVFRDVNRKVEQRAQELLDLVSTLGPTAIKVGQALSVRPDLINAEYASALATLQDQVPPFETAKAQELLREQLGDKYDQLGLKAGAGPVASASIGQVYRGTVGNKDVAVKVQRPNVLAEIALDLHIVREFAPIYAKITKSGSDLQALANEWGRGFIYELDYREEAQATKQFNRAMEERNLNAVCAPIVVDDFSTEQILVTEWVDGTRLDQSESRDVPRLCAVALNAYLVMLLEPNLRLHCDPHPGNLLRTSDGKLCILDFGMTLEIDNDLQYSLLEYVAHLTANDFDRLPEDLVKLGFLKPSKLEFANRSGVLEPLKYFLRQAGQGGGAKQVRERIFSEYREKYPGSSDEELRKEMRSEMQQQIKEVIERESVATGITMEVEELQKRNQDAFQIPEWFLYTSRAFLTLEGVSLQADEDYSIIKSCFPYVAKRLVGDEDPRAQQALKELIYGAGNLVDVEKLSDLADGFSSYTTTTKTINQRVTDPNQTTANLQTTYQDSEEMMLDAQATLTLVKDSADILLAPEGNIVQNLLLDESVLAASAGVKDTMRRVLLDGPRQFREAVPFGSVLPPLPFESAVEPFIRKTDKEAKAQELAEKLTQAVVRQSSSSSDSQSSGFGESASDIFESISRLEPEQAALVVKELRENAPKYGPLVGQLGEKFVDKLVATARNNVESVMRG